jgi:SAM-dependent methyltransferase
MTSSPRFPSPLKRLLVLIANAARRQAWLVYDYVGAVAHGRLERCSVCGRVRPMLYRRRVIPRRLEALWGLTPPLAEAFARKESCDCAQCGAKLRGRRLAQVLLSLYPAGQPAAPVLSLARWVLEPEIRELRVAELNRIDGLHEELVRLPHLAWSEFEDASISGSTSAGARSEDLTRLSYGSESLDVLLTSETLEHVSDLGAALREIRRVLVPAGRHLFTVPVLPGVAETFARSVALPDGTLQERAPRICHPGGDWGYPVFTEFGADLPQLLEKAGFEVEVYFGPPREADLAQVYVCRKPSR